MVFGWKREFKTLEAVKEKVSAGTVEPTPGSSSDDNRPITRGELKAMWEQYQVNQQPVTLAIADQNKKLEDLDKNVKSQKRIMQDIRDNVKYDNQDDYEEAQAVCEKLANMHRELLTKACCSQ